MAAEYGCLVAGPLSTTLSYKNNLGKEAVQQEFQRQVNVFKDQNVDFLIAEVSFVIFHLTESFSCSFQFQDYFNSVVIYIGTFINCDE